MSVQKSRGSAVVLLSGGIDSATCLGLAIDEYDEIQPVFYDYGQQTLEVERRNAHRLTAWAEEETEVEVHGLKEIDYQGVFGHFAEGVADPDQEFSHMVEEDGRSSGYVPMRNLHLIASGAGVADHEDHDAVFHGAQMGDSADYPDCRPQFARAVQQAVAESLPDEQVIEVRTPLIHMGKTEVIETATQLGVPLEYTYSCYDESGVEDLDPCGKCPACEERVEAFAEAGLEDPILAE